jgi:hypothetical protein
MNIGDFSLKADTSFIATSKPLLGLYLSFKNLLGISTSILMVISTFCLYILPFLSFFTKNSENYPRFIFIFY